MLGLLKIKGDSLAPEFQEGDFVVILKIPPFRFKPSPGDIVVFRHPEYGVMIKMVESLSQNGLSMFVVGTHPDSIDSRRFGAIPRRDLIGKVIWHVRKPGAG